MSQVIRVAAAMIVCTLAACGGKSLVTDDPDEQGGAGGAGQSGSSNHAGKTSKGGTPGTAGTAQGGTEQGGSFGTGGSIGKGGSGQGGAAGACGSFDDEPPSFISVDVAIHNQTSAPIYLGQDMVNCSVEDLFQVQDASGTVLSNGGSCRQACQNVRNGESIGCPTICAYPATIALQPGEVYYTQWSGQYTVPRELPPECAPSVQQCTQLKTAGAGVYTFSAVAGSGVDCSATTGMCGVCTPDSGGCRLQGSLITGAKHEASTVEMLDGSFGLYDLPAPSMPGAAGSASSGAAPAPPVRIVNIIFTK